MKKIILLLLVLSLSCIHTVMAAATNGSLTANGEKVQMQFAVAFETDSVVEPGVMDVVIVISDQNITEPLARNREKLEQMARDKKLAGLRVVLNPDSKVMSAEPLHAALTTQISSASWAKWEPKEFSVNKVAGRLYTDGMQDESGQKWEYDITFSAPIILDPGAKTIKK